MQDVEVISDNYDKYGNDNIYSKTDTQLKGKEEKKNENINIDDLDDLDDFFWADILGFYSNW